MCSLFLLVVVMVCLVEMKSMWSLTYVSYNHLIVNLPSSFLSFQSLRYLVLEWKQEEANSWQLFSRMNPRIIMSDYALYHLTWTGLRSNKEIIKVPWITKHNTRIFAVWIAPRGLLIPSWACWSLTCSGLRLSGSTSCLVPNKEDKPFGILHCFCKDWSGFSLWYLPLSGG